MPLWRIYTPPDLLNASQKSSLAQAITANYTRIGLPAFYAVILFIPIATSDIFVSGVSLDSAASKTPPNFMRIAVEHIARHQPDVDGRRAMMGRISGLLGTQIEKLEEEMGCEIRWEVHITETPRDLWTTNGLEPPASGSEMEAIWAREDRPVKL